MQLFSALPYKFVPLDGTVDTTSPVLSFIVKATFALENKRLPIALPAEDQAEFMGDERYMDEIGRSLRFANDLVLFKPCGEVLLTANCHAPNGHAVTSVEAGLNIGPISKRLRVFGDRVWLRDAQGNFIIEGPVPFREMPLRWERAFGGLNFAHNPMGRGIEPWTAEDGRKLFYLANIESPDRPTASQERLPPPEGFAPISPQWQPRFGREGTRDQHWATFVAPLPPRDYDERTVQAAPEDQWLKGYWKGDERIELLNMHPKHPAFVTALPGTRLRFFVQGQFDDGKEVEFGEVPLNLDTVHIDMTTERMHLTWRRQYHPHRPGALELEAIYLAEEPLSEEPQPIEAHYEDFLELKGPVDEPMLAKILRDEQAALAEARKTLVDAKIDESIIARFDAAPDSQAKFEMIIDLLKSKTAELKALTAALKPV